MSRYARRYSNPGAVAAGAATYMPVTGNLLAAGEMVPPNRLEAVESVTSSITQSVLYLSYFTAYRTETINSVETYTGGTAAAATPTLCRKGIYSIAADGAGTLVASTANDTTLWAGTFTAYNKALSAPFSKVAGRRYAIGLLVVTGAATPVWLAPTTAGLSLVDTLLGRAPRMCAALTAQTDLPASFADASLAASRRFPAARLVP